VLKDPAPLISVAALGDSAVTIGVSPWTSVGDYGLAGGEINKAVIEAFRERGIVIPAPLYDVRMVGKAA